MPYEITDGHQMLIPLYHGTSEIFLASIKKHGLGAKNPNDEFRSYECMSDLLTIMQRQSWFDDENLAAQEWMIQTMVSQQVTDGGFNFRYGGTYLSSSILTARRYALNNRYGSEFLSHTISLLENLEVHDQGLAQEISQRYPNVANLRGVEHKPLLVEATCVPMLNLRSENGGGVFEEIEKMRGLVDGIDLSVHDLMWQQSNFELIAPLLSRQLKYLSIEWA